MPRVMIDVPEEAYDHYFTAEKIAEIRGAADEARTGNNMTLDEIVERMPARRRAWHAKPSGVAVIQPDKEL